MKLRIPRRIKVEEDSSESESENVPAESTSAPDPEDKAPAASSKTILVSPTALAQCFLGTVLKSNLRVVKSK